MRHFNPNLTHSDRIQDRDKTVQGCHFNKQIVFSVQ